ncbi:LysR family transcriptional regulator [Rhizobium sp. NLR17b]|uniref:LysR substrate-binding domain-containing protein n=1 Tax=Rhizobium sp. NLR17b TaxID=2731114 RepID=UPI001C837344|nr:LysR substrate-binding domain-containing protein [Rhizobium sp. NLR17b]MBX5273234.1 LysR family transcriptional regulator [Rhizobium sp. NLR17b]
MNSDKLPNLRHLRLALLVLRGDSLRVAAEKLRLTQPAASLALSALEKSYEVLFFTRTPIGLAANEFGDVIRLRASNVFDELAAAFPQSVSEPPKAHVASRITIAQVSALAAMQQQNSFRAASEVIGVLPTTIQRAISSLEADLGVKLTERDDHAVRLNLAGRRLSEYAGRAVAEAKAIRADILELKGVIGGVVSMGVVRAAASDFVPNAVAEVANIAGEVRFEILQENLQIMLGLLRGGRIDVVCSTIRDEFPADIEREMLGRTRLGMYCSPSHPLAGQAICDIRELSRFGWVLPSAQTGAAKAFRRLFKESGVDLPSVVVETNSTEIIQQLVQTRFFLTISTKMDGAGFWGNELEQIVFDAWGLERPMWLMYRKGWRPTKLQELVLESLRRLCVMSSRTNSSNLDNLE